MNVIVDFVDPPEMRSSLGDDFRVEARVTVAHLDDVVKTPNGAVFRQRDEPAVFVVVAGRARVRPITLGRRNRLEAEVSGGLSVGEHVILYPGDKVHEGVRVSVRH